MSAERLSATWALRKVLGAHAQELSEELLFGLGVGMWFRWDPAAQQVCGLHPLLVQRALLGMNVTTMVFRHVDPGALRLLAEREGEPTLASLAAERGPSRGGVTACAPGPWVVVRRVTGAAHAASATVEFEHPAEGLRALPGREFLARWMGVGRGHACGVWIVPLCLRLRFDLAFAVRRALWLFCEQMSASFPSLGATGLPGLAALAARAAAPGAAVAVRTADEGACLQRDRMAAFVQQAAVILGRRELERPAALLRESAELWREALSAAFTSLAGELLSSHVRQAWAFESAAVAELRRVIRWQPAGVGRAPLATLESGRALPAPAEGWGA